MGEDDRISAEEYDRWVTPADAVLRLPKIPTRAVIIQIFNRLKSGHLKAVAHHITTDRSNYDFQFVASFLWENAEIGIAASDFWPTGDITIYLPTSITALFGVRFDPVELAHFAPDLSTQKASDTQNEDGVSEQEKDKNLPPVSEAHLAEWYELYRKVYSDAEDTTKNAEASARGCFPGKSIARQRIRDLFDERKRGRKTQPKIE